MVVARITAACGAPASAYGRLILAGQALGWLGDVLLIGRGTAPFLAGLAVFLAGGWRERGQVARMGSRRSIRGVATAVTWSGEQLRSYGALTFKPTPFFSEVKPP